MTRSLPLAEYVPQCGGKRNFLVKQGQANQCRTPGVKFWAKTVVFWANTVFFCCKYSAILGKYSGILGIQWYFGQIQ